MRGRRGRQRHPFREEKKCKAPRLRAVTAGSAPDGAALCAKESPAMVAVEAALPALPASYFPRLASARRPGLGGDVPRPPRLPCIRCHGRQRAYARESAPRQASCDACADEPDSTLSLAREPAHLCSRVLDRVHESPPPRSPRAKCGSVDRRSSRWIPRKMLSAERLSALVRQTRGAPVGGV